MQQVLHTSPAVSLALLDLGLPDNHGLDSLAWLHEAAPNVRVIVLSADEQPETIRAVIDTALGAPVRPPSPPLDLSPRQIDVLRMLIEGKSNKVIGRELGLSESTVKTHLGAIFRRLEVNSRTQAVLAAARLGRPL